VSGYRHEPLLLVCPNGHSETFKAEGISKTLMGGAYTRVNNQGKVIETHDPNVETHAYRCDVCGERFTRCWQDGAMLADPKFCTHPSIMAKSGGPGQFLCGVCKTWVNVPSTSTCPPPCPQTPTTAAKPDYEKQETAPFYFYWSPEQIENAGVHIRPKTAPKRAERMDRLGGR